MNPDNDLTTLISKGVDIAKQGDARSVYNAIGSFNAESIPAKSHYAAGWILYYCLHQAGDKEILPRKRMLAEYLALSAPRPHKLHSMILLEAMRLYKDAKNLEFNALNSGRKPAAESSSKFSIARFVNLWNLDNLRPGDWKRKEFEGKQLSSTVEKLITIIVDELDAAKEKPSEQFVNVMQKALAEYPDSYNLSAQWATIQIAAGNLEEAKEYIRKALLLAPGKFHLWSMLGSVTSLGQEPRLRMALFAKALYSPGQDQFKGRIRLRLAEIWLERGCKAQGKYELDKVAEIYRRQNWHLPAEHARLSARIPADTESASPEPMYRKLIPMAEEYLYSSLPAIEARKTYHKISEKDSTVAWRITDAAGTNYWIQPRRFGISQDLPMSTPLQIRVYNGKVVDARV